MAATDVIVTCHTEGCGNADVHIRMPGGTEMDGEFMPIESYTCGVCWQPITDVRRLEPGDEDRIDNTLPEVPEPKSG